ncbi:hypothetical protein ES288_A01G182600v1 [Gossypium darwinii]|uniref:Uncharacterized protein n=1 Tax=Gossypium darwinii TaxID=34276 RepID=A0A5D2HMR4_GOSDA|nr:hypothetical protein ES288_A01G182600v1 [Gossypium darwinii]
MDGIIQWPIKASLNHKSVTFAHKPQNRHLVSIVTKQARIRRFYGSVGLLYGGRGCGGCAWEPFVGARSAIALVYSRNL